LNEFLRLIFTKANILIINGLLLWEKQGFSEILIRYDIKKIYTGKDISSILRKKKITVKATIYVKTTMFYKNRVMLFLMLNFKKTFLF